MTPEQQAALDIVLVAANRYATFTLMAAEGQSDPVMEAALKVYTDTCDAIRVVREAAGLEE